MSTEVNPEATSEGVAETPELGDAGKKAIAAERARADKAEKALKALQADAEARAAAELSELERVKKERDELATSKSASEKEAIRLKVALEKGLPVNLAARLQGDDYDALVADADSLLEFIPADAKLTPKLDPSQGPKAAVGEQSPGALFEAHIKEQLGH